MSSSNPAFVGALPSALPTSRPQFQLQTSTFVARPPHTRRARLSRSCGQRSIAVCSAAPQVKSLEELQQVVSEETEAAIAAIGATDDLDKLEKLRVLYLGKKGTITSVMKAVGKLQAEERPQLGTTVNKSKVAITELIESRKENIEDMMLEEQEKADWIDVTMPGIRHRPTVARIHPINSTMDTALDIFMDLGYEVVDDPDLNREVETDYYCFEALNCPKDHPAREMQDTFYLREDKSLLLRTQTSAVQIRYMEKNKPPFRIIAPGRVFRRDTVDATHTSTFHQIEILAVDEYGVLNLGKLKATIIHFLKGMLGNDIETRFRGSYFPFTEPSMEVDVYFRGRWLEVLGCGMVDPAVLENVGYDPKKYSGFAAGFGVERFAMVMHEITDIRELYLNDMRFITQGMMGDDMG